jgi:hypothetical protein
MRDATSRKDHGDRDENVATYVRTVRTRRDVRSVANATDAAGVFSAGTVVARYADARRNAGLATTPQQRGIMGRYARELILGSRWSPEIILQAVEVFAATRRHPRFLAEWVATVFNKQTEAEYQARKADDRAAPAPDVAAAMVGILKRI